MNKQIKKLHNALGKTARELSKRLGKTSDPDEAEAILRELEEVNFRVMMSGRLLFRQTTTRIDQRIDDVIQANTDLGNEIKQIERTKAVIRAVGKFLGKVDQILDAVKVLAI